MSRARWFGRLALGALFVAGCAHGPRLTTWRPMTPDRFDVLAQRLNLPLAWRDDDGDGSPTPDELHGLLFYGPIGASHAEPPAWTHDGDFTPALREAVDRIFAADGEPPPSDARLARVRDELDRGQPSLLVTDARSFSHEDREFLRRMIVVADRIDALFAHQRGLDALATQIPADDTIDLSYFRAGMSPLCPRTAGPTCTAIPGVTHLVIDPWPAELQDGTDDFCASMMAEHATWSGFTVVRRSGEGLVGVPYPEAYASWLAPIASALREAADALGANEAPLAAYLRASADDLVNGAIAALPLLDAVTPRTSAWFVSIGAHNGRWDPCWRKAAYELALGRFDAGTTEQMQPVLSRTHALAEALSTLAPVVHRDRPGPTRVTDFARVVLLAGSDRAFEVDGFSTSTRSIVYTNLTATSAQQDLLAASHARLLTAGSMNEMTSERVLAYRMLTLLHETSHDLAVWFESADFRQSPPHPLERLVSEMYAESAAVHLARVLGAGGAIDSSLAERIARVSAVYDASFFASHAYSRTGARDATAQAAAIRFGIVMELGAARWDPSAASADGHAGAIVIDFDRLADAQEEVARRAMQVMATADWATVEDWIARYVDHGTVPRDALIERAAHGRFAQTVFAIDW